MQSTTTAYHDAGILTRLVGMDPPLLSTAAAEGLLALEFSPADKERMRALMGKARAGALTPDELCEVEAYDRVRSLLGILKSKARRALKTRGVNGKSKAH
jgi:hypothetical protein